MRIKIQIIRACILLFAFAPSFHGYAQVEKFRNGLSDRAVRRVRSELVQDLRNKMVYGATTSKDLLLVEQPNIGDYLSYDEYFMILFLTGEFGEILDPEYNDEHQLTEDPKYPSIQQDLRELMIKQTTDIITEIDHKYAAYERVILKRQFYTIKDKSRYAYKSPGISVDPILKPKDQKSRPEKFFTENEFIYFYDDSIINCENINRDKKRLSCDGLVFNKKTVKFYADGIYYYANINKAGESPDFYKRYYSGAINIYTKEYYVESGGDFSFNYGTVYDSERGMYIKPAYIPRKETQIEKHYYNFGYGDVKKATYRNLNQDISENPECKIYLEKYKNKRRKENTLTIIGGFLIAGGLAFIGTSSEVVVIGTVSGTATLLINVGLIRKNDKRKYLEKAIRAFK